MKRILFFLTLFVLNISASAQKRTLITDKAIINDSIQIAGRWVRLVSPDSTFSAADHRSIPTTKAVKDWVLENAIDTIYVLVGAGADPDTVCIRADLCAVLPPGLSASEVAGQIEDSLDVVRGEIEDSSLVWRDTFSDLRVALTAMAGDISAIEDSLSNIPDGSGTAGQLTRWLDPNTLTGSDFTQSTDRMTLATGKLLGITGMSTVSFPTGSAGDFGFDTSVNWFRMHNGTAYLYPTYGTGTSGLLPVYSTNGIGIESSRYNNNIASDWNVSDNSKFYFLYGATNGPVGGTTAGISIPTGTGGFERIMQIAADHNTGPYFRMKYNGTWLSWHRIMTQNNGGAGSLFNADLLDGISSENFSARTVYSAENWNVSDPLKFTLVGSSTNSPVTGQIYVGAHFPYKAGDFMRGLQIASAYGTDKLYFRNYNNSGTYTGWKQVATGYPIAGNIPFWGANFTAAGDTLRTNPNFYFSTSNTRLHIGGNNPQRTLHVTGEARITDLTTDPPTQIVGADADGDLGAVTLGAGLSLSSGTLNGAFLPLTGGTLTGTLLFSADNTYNIGASGATRPANGYFGTKVFTPAIQISTGATNGYYLKSDATGNGTWSALPAADGNGIISALPAGNVNIDADENTLEITNLSFPVIESIDNISLTAVDFADITATALRVYPNSGQGRIRLQSNSGFYNQLSAASGLVTSPNLTLPPTNGANKQWLKNTGGGVAIWDYLPTDTVNLSLTGTSQIIELTNSAGTDIVFKGVDIGLTKVTGTKDTLYFTKIEHWGEVSISGGSTSTTAATPERPDNDTPGMPTASLSSEFTQSGSTVTYIGAAGQAEVTGTISFTTDAIGDYLISLYQEGVEMAATEVRVSCLIGSYVTIPVLSTSVNVATNDTFDLRIEPVSGSATITVHRYNVYARKIY